MIISKSKSYLELHIKHVIAGWVTNCREVVAEPEVNGLL